MQGEEAAYVSNFIATAPPGSDKIKVTVKVCKAETCFDKEYTRILLVLDEGFLLICRVNCTTTQYHVLLGIDHI